MNVIIDLKGDCKNDPGCTPLAYSKFTHLSNGDYDFPISVQQLPMEPGRTAKRRSNRCRRLGYTFSNIAREVYNKDIYDINSSAPVRQGRPMHPAYMEYYEHSPLPEYHCPLHNIKTYGILKDDRLFAYNVIYKLGDLVLVCTLLGHADYMKDDIMYLLMTETLNQYEGIGFYNRHDSGTEGLRYFKEKLGFRPARIEWRI